MSNDELGNFDPEMMRDPKYKELVLQAKAMMNNSKDIIRSQESKQPVQPTVPPETVKESKAVLSDALQTNQPIDFNIHDFQNMMKLDNNSTIAKMQNVPQTGSKPIGSIWMNREEMKKYFACKNVFKIKVHDEIRYRTYRFHSVNSEQQEKLFGMAEDVRTFYPLMVTEGAEIDEGNEQPTRVLVREGKNYKHIKELVTDYKKEIALMCLGIEYDEYETLEQFSDPNFTILDIWGINDILDGVFERAISGTSYFLIPSDKL